MTQPPDETREQRRQLFQRALADVARHRIARQRLRQTGVARSSGISRTHLQAILRADKGCTMFRFVELSRGLEIQPGELLGEVLKRCDWLRAHR